MSISAAVTEARATGSGTREARAVSLARRIAEQLFGPAEARDFAIRYWDSGAADALVAAAPAVTLVLRHPAAFRRMLLPPSQLALTEAFVRGDVDVEGDLEAAAGLADRVRARLATPGVLRHLLPLLIASPATPAGPHAPRLAPARRGRDGRLHSPRRDAAAIRAHYDVGNAFYALWLDRRMVYSCAYFPTGAEDIDAAQEAKLELICRKLRLRPGDRLLDIGCGWGGLVLYAAERYGVTATGVTLSPSQAEWARARAAEQGLAERVRIEVRDYRALEGDGVFDKLASIGMCEHVGHRELGTYFAHAHRLLRPGGLFLNTCIVDQRERARATWRDRLWHEGTFIDRYVFPDGELPRLGPMLREAGRAGFETCDVESLREHYALTLRRWVRRLEAAREQAVAEVGEPTYRVWRLYMAGSAYGFARGAMGLAQALLAKPEADGRVGLPLTREDLYAGRTGGREDGRVAPR
ncbi:MAG TPA: cyclopropane-fatty-acyl-phospholipid synthase family protein [Gemmatimonadales bacterium]|nr:cyclopropane-fatty-acyl-phospholipid synthase family protein [Gemmatimonadales bacterium]